MFSQNIPWSSALKDVNVSVWNKGFSHLLREEIPHVLGLQIHSRFFSCSFPCMHACINHRNDSSGNCCIRLDAGRKKLTLSQ